jgi:hypothetical protein
LDWADTEAICRPLARRSQRSGRTRWSDEIDAAVRLHALHSLGAQAFLGTCRKFFDPEPSGPAAHATIRITTMI